MDQIEEPLSVSTVHKQLELNNKAANDLMMQLRDVVTNLDSNYTIATFDDQDQSDDCGIVEQLYNQAMIQDKNIARLEEYVNALKQLIF